MFIRETKTTSKKTGTAYITHRLVESYHTEKGTRQRVILHLGTLSLPKSKWRDLAIVLESKLSGQELLINNDSELEYIADNAISHHNLLQKRNDQIIQKKERQELLTIDINSLATSEHRSLGPELVANAMWNLIGFDDGLSQCMFTKKEISLAKVVVLGKLIAPSSDLDTWKWLKTRTSILEMLNVDLTKVGKNQIYEIADLLLQHKEKIEHLLRKREEKIFNKGCTIYLYDLTNTYFEGSNFGNELAARGKCKSKRTDCPLVSLSLVVDSHGFPIFSEIYKGNQSEPETFENVIKMIEKYKDDNLFGLIKPTIAMDRGIATTETQKLLREKHNEYVVIERGAVEKKYLKEFENAKETFEKFEIGHKSSYGDMNDLYLKKMENDDLTCRVLCLSEGKMRKEAAIDTKKEERFVNELTGLKNSVEKKRYVKKKDKVYERIGRIKQKYSGIAKYYDIETKIEEDNITSVKWTKKPKREERSILEGCYVIETTHKDLGAKEIWNLYMTLTRVEDAFKALKSDLGLRPIYHQNTDRVKGHLFVSVLAYHLLICIETKLSAGGDNRRWSSINKELSTHQRSTVIITDENDCIHHVRISGNPEVSHKQIYKLLGVKDTLKKEHKMVKIGF